VWSALRVINVWAYVKTGAIYAAAFGLLIFGLGFISWSFGSACPPTCPPVPPNPAVGWLGAAMVLSAIGIFFLFGFYYYFWAWRRFYFLSVVFRYPDGREENVDIAVDENDPRSVVELSRRDMTYFNTVLPDRVFGHGLRVSWWLVRNSLDDTFYVLGSPFRPDTLTRFFHTTVVVQGKLANVRMGFLEADVWAVGTLLRPEQQVSLLGRGRGYEVARYEIPVALVTGSVKHTQLRMAAQAELPAFMGPEHAIGVLREVADAAKFEIQDMSAVEREKYRRVADAALDIVSEAAEYDVVVSGVPIYEQREMPRPPMSRKVVIVLLALVAAGVAAALLLTVAAIAPRPA
jgi:hypothetical protein